mmetsp:Transcript_6918/g.13048  ORF Transcript_6918/g.13048 Transcript_6918/m.13048 type:complete len:250 (+) Transcript_6918:92-841(+)
MPMLASSVSGSNRMLPIALIGAAATVGVCTFLKKKSHKHKENSCSSHHDIHHSIQVTLPEWAVEELSEFSNKEYKTDEEKMALAIHLSARNVAEKTGGPFGCAIFEKEISTGVSKLVSIGVNRVVSLCNSTLHGETVAIQLAQSKLNSFTMNIPHENGKSKRVFELFTSCEPCAMCLGATFWSGVSRMVCGATKADAEAIGFNEGPVFEASYDHLREAGIEVTRQVLQKEAAQVLKEYGESGLIYNGGD